MLNLVTHDKSAKSCSKADLFDHICERQNVVKRIFLYQQRRFAKVGKAAASILNAKDILSTVLDEIDSTNQLVVACKIYMASDLFWTELESLAFFNHHITFPFLNCIEGSSQSDLLKILPNLYKDLLEKRTDTLSDFIVQIHGMPTPTLTTDLSKEVCDMMCLSAAEAIKLQCGREYGFADEDEKLRATDLSKLTSHELENFPTENLVTEREFSKFDREARVARCRNRKFKAKNIRNNMQTYKMETRIVVDKVSRKICEALAIRESVWTDAQKVKFKERIEMKLTAAKKSQNYTAKLLDRCKSWGGPCTSVNELHEVLQRKPDIQNDIVKYELGYYVHTHKSEKQVKSDLFRMNKISHDEKLENLTILLAGDDCNVTNNTICDLPTNEDVLLAMNEIDPTSSSQNPNRPNLQINELCVSAWQNSVKEYVWYIGYVQKINDDGYVIDYMHRSTSSYSKWKYPDVEDVQTAEDAQIVPCDVQGFWDNSPDTRIRLFTLKNVKQIDAAFQTHIQ